jgi:hypothetical protein
MDKTQEIIKEQLKKLPQNIRNAISSIDLGDKIRKIANKNMLHIDQAGDLETETVLVMLGLEPTADYKENIRRELNISRDRAQAITADIDKEIFMTIRESLKKISQEEVAKEETSAETIEKPHLVTPPLSHSGVLPPSDESEEIKKQVAEQHAVKPVVAPPPNLPTGAPARPNFAEQNLGGQAGAPIESPIESPVEPSAETKEPHLETKFPSEEKKPTHIDPYREPIE